MTIIRYFAALLLILNGILHTLPMFDPLKDTNATPMLIFGIVYFIIGLMLIREVRYAPLLGVIFPLIGLLIGLFVIGMLYWDSALTNMMAINVIVAGCCIYLTQSKSTVPS